MNELSIKVGGVYRARLGDKVSIVAELNHPTHRWLGVIHNVITSDGYSSWCDGGSFRTGRESPLDLIDDWKDSMIERPAK